MAHPDQSESEDDPLAARKRLTFAQGEGLVPLPSQLARGEISREFRAVLWEYLHRQLQVDFSRTSGTSFLKAPWIQILKSAHVYHHHRPVDEFPENPHHVVAEVKKIILKGEWFDVLGLLEFILKHRHCPSELPPMFDAIMTYCRLGYRVVGGQVICPVASEVEHQTIEGPSRTLACRSWRGLDRIFGKQPKNSAQDIILTAFGKASTR